MDTATLRDRLRQVVNGGHPPASSDAPSGTAQSAQPQAAPNAAMKRDRGPELTTILGGEWRDDEHGRSFVVRRCYGADETYGAYTVGQLAATLHASQSAVPLLGGAQASGPFVFFDLETTGLSGGAGTCAFIVGCAWFEENGSFVTEQHLLVDYGTEKGMLRRAAQDLSRAGAFVTFNGKSFDAPVIETRYLFHRMTSPCAERPHVDLVHPSRRFWGGTSESGCSLIALERDVLSVRRIGDVPGFEIPARYFQFIRSGDARPLAGVLEHNRMDLLSLAGLTAYLMRLVDAGPSDARHALEALALGRTYERAGLDERAESAYEHALTTCSHPVAGRRPLPRQLLDEIQVDALRALAIGARRQRRYDAAALRWQQLIDFPRCPRDVAREAMEALAIHHEHRVRDLATAKQFALKSLDEGSDAAWGDAVRHRLKRLDRKISERRSSLFPSSWPAEPSSGSLRSARRTSS